MPRPERSTFVRDRAERTAAGEHGTTMAPVVGLLWRAFGSRRGVGECEQHRTLVDRAHPLDNDPGERPRRAGSADQHVRFQRVDGGAEIETLVIVRVRKVVRHQVGPRLHHETVHVDEPQALPGIRVTEALTHQRGCHEVGDAGGCGACAEEHDPQIAERALDDPGGRGDAGEGHRRRALDVVVETEHAVAIRVEQSVGVGCLKVFELNQRARIFLLHRAHEFFYEREVRRTGEAAARIPDVERILEQLGVVGADVEHHRQAVSGWNARARRVKRQLADRNAHAVGTEVAKPEDALPVGDDDHPNVLLGPVAEDRADTAAVGRRDVKAFRLPRDVRELRASLPNSGRVNPRHGFFDVGDQRPVEQPFVALLHRRQGHVAIDVAGQRPELGHRAIDELRLGGDYVGQEALEAESQALLAREGNGFVERLVVEIVEGFPGCHGHEIW